MNTVTENHKFNVMILHETRLVVSQAVSLLNELKVAINLMTRLNVGEKRDVVSLIKCSNDIKQQIDQLNNVMIVYNNTSNKTEDIVHDVKQASFTLRSYVVDSDRLLRDVLRA